MLKKSCVTALIALSAFLTASSPTFALQVSPPKQLYVANPGDTVQDKIMLIGTESRPTKVSLITQEFRKEGEENDRVFIDPKKGGNTIGNWIKIKANTQQTVTFGQVVEIPFEIVIPKDAPPGGNYGTITAILEDPNNKSAQEVGVQSRVIAQLLLSVSGDVKEKLAIESFGTENQQWFYPHLPAKFITRIKNEGNVHIIPKGFVELFQGNTRVAVLPINPQNLEAFPQSIRKYAQEWKREEEFQPAGNQVETFFKHVVYEFKHFQVGLYEARLGVVYGPQKNIFLQDSVKIVIFPWHLFLVILVIVLMFAAWRVSKHFKKKKIKSEKSA